MSIKKMLLILPVFLLFFGCTNNDDLKIPEETKLKEVTYEVILFEFTPDTGNNSLRLRYEIKFTNPNAIAIKGFHKVTTNADGIISSTISTNYSPCYSMDANSDCTINFDEEDSFDLGKLTSLELVSVEYVLED